MICSLILVTEKIKIYSCVQHYNDHSRQIVFQEMEIHLRILKNYILVKLMKLHNLFEGHLVPTLRLS